MAWSALPLSGLQRHRPRRCRSKRPLSSRRLAFEQGVSEACLLKSNELQHLRCPEKSAGCRMDCGVDENPNAQDQTRLEWRIERVRNSAQEVFITRNPINPAQPRPLETAVDLQQAQQVSPGQPTQPGIRSQEAASSSCKRPRRTRQDTVR